MTGTKSPSPNGDDNPQRPKTSRGLILQAIADGPLTPSRCNYVVVEAMRVTAEMPWRQRLALVMTEDERAHVIAVWNALAIATWQDAFDLLALGVSRDHTSGGAQP